MKIPRKNQLNRFIGIPKLMQDNRSKVKVLYVIDCPIKCHYGHLDKPHFQTLPSSDGKVWKHGLSGWP